jgi:hypothetical protein
LARDFGGTMHCGRCAMSWQASAREEAPHCKPKAAPPIGLAEMIEVVEADAADKMASQSAIVRAGLPGPCLGMLRRIAVLMAAARVLQCIAADKDMLQQLKGTL